MSNKTKAVMTILLGSVLGGAVSTTVKLAIKDIPPFTFSFIRFFIASLFLLPLFFRTSHKFDKDFKRLLLLSLLPTLNIAFFVIGIKSTTASVAQMLYAGTPIIVGLLSYFLFGQRMKLKRWIFISMGLLGVLFVVFLPLFQSNVPFIGDLQGNLLISLGVICWSIYAVYSKELQKKFSPIIITSIFFFVSTILFLLLSFFEISTNNFWWYSLNMQSIIAMLYVTFIGTIAVYLLNQYSFKYANPVIGSFSLYLVPIFTYFSAFILLGERLTGGLIIGTILVFISTALTSYYR